MAEYLKDYEYTCYKGSVVKRAIAGRDGGMKKVIKVVATTAAVGVVGFGVFGQGLGSIGSTAAKNTVKAMVKNEAFGMSESGLANASQDMVGNIISDVTGLDGALLNVLQDGMGATNPGTIIQSLIVNYGKDKAVSLVDDYINSEFHSEETFEEYIKRATANLETTSDVIYPYNGNKEGCRYGTAVITGQAEEFPFNNDLSKPAKSMKGVTYVHMQRGDVIDLWFPVYKADKLDYNESDFSLQFVVPKDGTPVDARYSIYGLSQIVNGFGEAEKAESMKVIDKIDTGNQYFLVTKKLAIPVSKSTYEAYAVKDKVQVHKFTYEKCATWMTQEDLHLMREWAGMGKYDIPGLPSYSEEHNVTVY